MARKPAKTATPAAEMFADALAAEAVWLDLPDLFNGPEAGPPGCLGTDWNDGGRQGATNACILPTLLLAR
eukprot:6139326-Amphidinium_carterae.1